MHTAGMVKEAQINEKGLLEITIQSDGKNYNDARNLIGENIVLDIQKAKEKRSLNANAYFWQLVDKIAKVVGSTKDEIYQLQLSRYGVFVDLQVLDEVLNETKRRFYKDELFSYIEEFEHMDGCVIIRCYYGSSKYDTKEMSELIKGTVNDAMNLGIETLTPEELRVMCVS